MQRSVHCSFSSSRRPMRNKQQPRNVWIWNWTVNQFSVGLVSYSQRCSPRGSCLGSRPPLGSFSACLALALPQRLSALAWLGLRLSASASARPHDFCICLGSVSKVLTLCHCCVKNENTICGIIWVYHYCGFVYTSNTARRELGLECLILDIFCMEAKR